MCSLRAAMEASLTRAFKSAPLVERKKTMCVCVCVCVRRGEKGQRKQWEGVGKEKEDRRIKNPSSAKGKGGIEPTIDMWEEKRERDQT